MAFDDERWAPIDGYPNYVISTHGRVWNIPRDRELYPTVRRRGYLQVALSNHYGPKSFYIHQLMGMTFMDVWRPRIQIAHLDLDKRNNHISNLYVRGESIKAARLREPRPHARRVQIIETGQIFRNAYAAARYISGDAQSIYKCLRGVQHKHLGYSFRYINTEEALRYGREHQIL